MKILVLGGSGFIGKHLVPLLLAGGHDVSVLNRGNRTMEGTTQYIANRDDPASMQTALSKAPAFDVVIDTSGYTLAQSTIARELLGHKAAHWVHLSTAAVYASSDDDYLPNEDDEIGSIPDWGAYGTDKSAIDSHLLGDIGHAPTTILRPPYLYGPHNTGDRETFIWSRLLKKRPVIVPGNGERVVQFLHVADLARAITLVAEMTPESRIYNVTNAELLSFAEWVNILAYVSGLAGETVFELGLSGLHPRAYFPFRESACGVDGGRFMAETGWAPQFNARAGFAQTWAAQDKNALENRVIDTTAEDALLLKLKGAA